ncbi:9148_t:CDS:1 [Acaulospora colombiana]|uniref:9148_t:CDS:1 n=1 Tax=Acaulospora colombiana TaxID=27376 RepID=A0ACA9MQJ6_9GLOM|nr:9148_t:CDS:1 [Acaulospora colombiana]
MTVAKGANRVFQMQFASCNINWSEFLNLPDELDHLEDSLYLLERPSFSLDSSFPSSLVELSPPFGMSPEGSPPPMDAYRIQHEAITTYNAPTLLSTLGAGIYGHILTSTLNSPASHTLSLGSDESNSNDQAIDFDAFLVDDPSLATCGSGGASGASSGTNNHASLSSIDPTLAATTMGAANNNNKKQSKQTTPVADELKTRGSPAPMSIQSSHPSPARPAVPITIPSIQTIATIAKGHIPRDAVFCDSDVELIRSKCQLLVQRLRNKHLSGSVRHPYMTCPVFDCERGGWNPLLHGEPPKDIHQPTTGHFFTSNEIVRHVKTKHAPENDLRCHHAGCKVQAKLDARTTNGKGRFCRRDVLRKRYKDYPEHRDSVPEDLRRKYKLFRPEPLVR